MGANSLSITHFFAVSFSSISCLFSAVKLPILANYLGRLRERGYTTYSVQVNQPLKRILRDFSPPKVSAV